VAASSGEEVPPCQRGVATLGQRQREMRDDGVWLSQGGRGMDESGTEWIDKSNSSGAANGPLL
jgi:hypothetical protein